MDIAAQLAALIDLEKRQEDLLKRLDELDGRVERVLKECLGSQPGVVAGDS